MDRRGFNLSDFVTKKIFTPKRSSLYSVVCSKEYLVFGIGNEFNFGIFVNREVFKIITKLTNFCVKIIHCEEQEDQYELLVHCESFKYWLQLQYDGNSDKKALARLFIEEDKTEKEFDLMKCFSHADIISFLQGDLF